MINDLNEIAMKKNYILSAIALCACILSACNKEIDAPQGEGTEENKEGVITYIRATGNENESKGSIDSSSGIFYWNEGDQIAVWNNGAYQTSIALNAEAGDIAGEKPTNATFRFSGELNNREKFAVFPASIADGDHATSDDFSINLKGTYTLAEVAGEKSPVPMIAVNDGDNLHFKQLGALLRITLNNLPPSTRSVTIDFNGKKVWGSFAVASTVTPGSSSIATSAIGVEDTHDIITINTPDISDWTDGQDVNIPVPTGTYTTITVKAWDAADGKGKTAKTLTIPTLQMTRWIKVKTGVSSNWKPIRTSARKVIASLPAFSIDAENRVAFAPGNLYWNGSAWQFHSEQYGATFGTLTADFAGETIDERESAFKGTSNRDLFQWAEMTGGITGKSIDFGPINGYNDWKLGDDFTLTITSGLSTRANRYVKITLPASKGFPDFTKTIASGETAATTWGGTPGLFIFPDNWDSSLLTSHMSSNVILNYKSAHYNSFDPKMTAELYSQLISAGAIFLPAPGMMSKEVSYTPTQGGTWTCNEYEEVVSRAYCCFFNNEGFSHNSGVGKTQYRTVRLVRDLN